MPTKKSTKPTTTATSESHEQAKTAAILSYLLVGIIWYFADKSMQKDSFAKFHVKQALMVWVAMIIVQIVGTIIPVLGWFLILPLGMIALMILMLLGLINAANGKKEALPIIGNLAEKWFTF